MKILLIDNNDSFTNNLEHLLIKEIKGAEVTVVAYSNEKSVELNSYDLLVISPGPGKPQDYPGYEAVIDSGKPVLGICLGMQIINEHFGGQTSRLSGCFHGRTENIDFNGQDLAVARYHSLYCNVIAEGLEIVAANSQGVPMAIAHNQLPLLGYQFHPESFLTEQAGVFIDYALDFLGISQL
ncbi:para-aminobenzoate synthetase component 2 [Maridesulfovibrio ferrireducens]|uniref:Para-aminobenzoate synthetase component 2 n=1 Tax=Maridesulfovibrio ferrireducens TaxID=246191 RepID=A0A1G9FEZ8_9BACT|nr:aminodeoxychorismate/anthranilate synthase component II [Maridesulfovibrio ferrireducens]SDK86912.1 para-aminobenzoate synthetase component 2 [Maridesulfovibrio ferrireducens]